MEESRQAFYDLSKQSFILWRKISLRCADIMKFHIYRYAGIVDNSERKLECPRAAMTMRFAKQDKEIEKMIVILEEMRRYIDEWLEVLKRYENWR